MIPTCLTPRHGLCFAQRGLITTPCAHVVCLHYRCPFPNLNKDSWSSSLPFYFYSNLEFSLIITHGILTSIFLLLLLVPCGFVEVRDFALLICALSSKVVDSKEARKRHLSNHWNFKAGETSKPIVSVQPTEALNHSCTYLFFINLFLFTWITLDPSFLNYKIRVMISPLIISLESWESKEITL